MPEDKRYETLKYLPTYGPMHISITDTGEPFYSEGYVVRFYKDDGTNWVANFKTGWGELSNVFELPDNGNLLIIAEGICYLMNPNEIKPIDTFGQAFNELLFIPEKGILLYGNNEIDILFKDGTRTNINTCFDGIKDVIVDDNIIRGMTNDYTDIWIPFEYNIDTDQLKAIGGTWHYIGDVKPKPWWKFW